MNDDVKARIIAAVERHAQKDLKSSKKSKNASPEAQVVRDLLYFYEENGFFMNRIESKAKNIGGIWRQAGVAEGTPDLVGICPEGYMHVNEVKAPGRRGTLRVKQREYLEKVITRGGFGICADSVQKTRELYNGWIKLRMRNKDDAIRLLLSQLPKQKLSTVDESF